jgi:hypothetical protein
MPDEAEAGLVCVSKKTSLRVVNNNAKPSSIATAKMPAIAEIDGFGLRPHIETSSRSSFSERPPVDVGV